MLKKTPH